MFGLSFGELLVLAVVALLVIGPRELPTVMRSLGRTIGRLKRMATNVRTESGIDNILHQEGIHREIHNFKRLIAGEILDDDELNGIRTILPNRIREYPRIGADGDAVVSEDDAAYLETYNQTADQHAAALPMAAGAASDGEAAAGGAAVVAASAERTSVDASATAGARDAEPAPVPTAAPAGRDMPGATNDDGPPSGEDAPPGSASAMPDQAGMKATEP